MLQHELKLLCEEVWKRLHYSKIHRISQGEETLTDNILLQLASKRLLSINVIKTPKTDEQITGTDWEWWIKRPTGGYIRYGIQAKKLDPKTNTYRSLRHQVGKKPHARYQEEILADYCAANHAVPLYAFYNHLEKRPYSKTWHCCAPQTDEHYGVTITSLANVQEAISKRGSRTFEKIHSFTETIPLHCLTCTNSSFSKIKTKRKIIQLTDPSHRSQGGELLEKLKTLEEIRHFSHAPPELYDHNLKLYPRRVAIIRLDSDQNSKT